MIDRAPPAPRRIRRPMRPWGYAFVLAAAALVTIVALAAAWRMG